MKLLNQRTATKYGFVPEDQMDNLAVPRYPTIIKPLTTGPSCEHVRVWKDGNKIGECQGIVLFAFDAIEATGNYDDLADWQRKRVDFRRLAEPRLKTRFTGIFDGIAGVSATMPPVLLVAEDSDDPMSEDY